MNRNRNWARILGGPALALVAAQAACGAVDGSALDQLEWRDDELVRIRVGNGLPTPNLAMNAMSTNRAANDRLVHSKLQTASFATSRGDELGYALHDPAARKFFEYLVSCALPEGGLVTYTDTLTPGSPTYSFSGAAGRCPSWGTTTPSLTCQRAVTACILARENRYGTAVQLSLRGENPLYAIESTDFSYPIQEGAFYGNLFQDPSSLPINVYVDAASGKVLVNTGTAILDRDVAVKSKTVTGSVYRNTWSCSAARWTNPQAMMNERLCAISGYNCVATYTGACRSGATPSNRCSIADGPVIASDGDFEKCIGGSITWSEVVTTFLKTPCDLAINNCGWQ